LLLHRARRFLAGAHRSRSFTYKIFSSPPMKRNEFVAPSLRATWPGRMWGY
jgi:hypothetical protein